MLTQYASDVSRTAIVHLMLGFARGAAPAVEIVVEGHHRFELREIVAPNEAESRLLAHPFRWEQRPPGLRA